MTRKVRAKLKIADPSRALFALAAVLWIALAACIYGADCNFWWHMTSYYGYQDMATYNNIDPSADQGQAYMDAGQVYFREGVRVATDEMVTFRSDGVYCAAPIVGQPIWNSDVTEGAETQGPV